MAKQQFPMTKGGSGVLSKLIGWLVLIAVLVMVVKHPVESAHWFSATVEALGTFLQAVHQ